MNLASKYFMISAFLIFGVWVSNEYLNPQPVDAERQARIKKAKEIDANNLKQPIKIVAGPATPVKSKKPETLRDIYARCNDSIFVGMDQDQFFYACRNSYSFSSSSDYGHTRYTHYKIPQYGRVMIKNGKVAVISY